MGSSARIPGMRRGPRLSLRMYGDLTEREIQVLQVMSSEPYMSNNQIAVEMFLARNTIKSHLFRIYHKLHVHGRREAILKAREMGLIE